MSDTIHFKRGPAATIPILLDGEPGVTTDTKKVFIGNGGVNIELPNKPDFDNHVGQTTGAHGGIVASSDVVTVAAANKLLKLDGTGKLPASITGDAPTVGGKLPTDFVNNQAAITYYVDINRPDDSGDGLTIGTAFKHLQYAINKLNKNLIGDVKIRVLTGDYSAEGQILVDGFSGSGVLTITAYDGAADVQSNSLAANYIIDSFKARYSVNGFIIIQSFRCSYSGIAHAGFWQYGCKGVNFLYCSDIVSAVRIGFQFDHGGEGQCANCIASNKSIAMVTTYGNQSISANWSVGTGNSTGLRTEAATIMKWDANQPQGTTAEVAVYGGVIR